MGFGGALSFNGFDSTIAAGVALTGIPQSVFTAVSKIAISCLGVPEPSVTFKYELPPVDVTLNVTVNGCSMTAETDGYGDLDIKGDLGLTKKDCNPTEGFEVPDIATAKNVLVNGLAAAIPDIPVDVAPIVDAAKMAMQTSQTNVIIYY